MKIDYKNPAELQKLIPTDLAALYELGNLKDMEAELKANGWLVAGTLSKDGIPIDCYRRLKVAVDLGWEEVPVIISELDATVENRVALNHAREKTWRDKRTDLVVSFETFGLKQGQKATTLVAYNRYDEIRKRHTNRLLQFGSRFVGIRRKAVSTHSLRKSGARFLYEENHKSEDVFLKISMILNHSSTQVSRRYLGITKEEISDVYAGFDILL